jgi:hypothetical protein
VGRIPQSVSLRSQPLAAPLRPDAALTSMIDAL